MTKKQGLRDEGLLLPLEFPLIGLIVLLLLGFQKQPHSIHLASSSLDAISKHSCGLQDCVL